MAAGWQVMMSASPSSSSVHLPGHLQQRHNFASSSLSLVAEPMTTLGRYSTRQLYSDRCVFASSSVVPHRPTDAEAVFSLQHRHHPCHHPHPHHQEGKWGRMHSSVMLRLPSMDRNERWRSALDVVRRRQQQQYFRASPKTQTIHEDGGRGGYRDRKSAPSRYPGAAALRQRLKSMMTFVRCEHNPEYWEKILCDADVEQTGRAPGTMRSRLSSSSLSLSLSLSSSSSLSSYRCLSYLQGKKRKPCNPSRVGSRRVGHMDILPAGHVDLPPAGHVDLPPAGHVDLRGSASGMRRTTEPNGLGFRVWNAHRQPAHVMLTRWLGCGIRYQELQCNRWSLAPTKRRWNRVTSLTLPSAMARPMDEENDDSSTAVGELIVGTQMRPSSLIASFLAWVDAYVRFTRPHTVVGTCISIASVSAMALQSVADINMLSFVRLLQALVSAYCINIAIVGLNQIFDIDIDRINKPSLPLASGEWTIDHAKALVIGHATAGILIGVWVGSIPLLLTLTISLLLGIAYSTDLPFLRWKQYPFVAAACILCVRAVLVQLGFFFHMRTLFFDGRGPGITKNLTIGLTVMCFYSLIIAFFKDIPDVEGDRRYGIRSFSVRLGQRKIFWICVGMLLAANASMVAVGLLSNVAWSKLVTVGGHLLMAIILWNEAKQQNFTKASLADYYMFVWKLFYAEYLLLPLVR